MVAPGPELIEAGGHPRRARLDGQRLLPVLVVLLVIGVAVLSVVALHYERASERRPSIVQPTPVASFEVRQPIIIRHRYRLLGGKLTVDVMAIAVPNAHRDRLILTGHVVGGIPNHRYVLAGRAWPCGGEHVSVQGVTDATGNGLLSGRVWKAVPGQTYAFNMNWFDCDRWLIQVQMPPT